MGVNPHAKANEIVQVFSQAHNERYWLKRIGYAKRAEIALGAML
jgi:hypothetical protein